MTGSVEIETLVSREDSTFPDDLDVAKDGSIYWSDASTIADIDLMLIEFLGPGTGRLMKYDQKTKNNTILISGLHMANGIQLSQNEDFVLVTETAKARVMRYM